MFNSRTLLPLIAFLLVVLIVAIVISPVVDIPKAGLTVQANLVLFFSAIVAAFCFRAGCLPEPRPEVSERISPPASERQTSVVLLC